jgi:hypothetical protein
MKEHSSGDYKEEWVKRRIVLKRAKRTSIPEVRDATEVLQGNEAMRHPDG